MGKNKVMKKSLSYFAILTIVISFTGCNKPTDVTKLDTKYVSAMYVVDMKNPEEVVGISSNVFIGFIEEMTGTDYILNIPYTRYNVKVIDNIKGELQLDATIQLNKEGGISEDRSCYLLYENDFLPDEEKYYIFNVRERIEDGSYTASGMNTVILLDDIDLQSITNDIILDNSDSSNTEQNDIKIKLDNSGIYQKYVDAYNNQIVYDPNK